MTRPDPGPSPGVELDVAETTRIADQLAQADVRLALAAKAAPELPRAGPSTGAVLAYLEALAHAGGGQVQATDALAGSLRDAVAETQRQDRGGAAHLAPPPGPTC